MFLMFIALFVVPCLVFLKFGGLEVLLTFCKEVGRPLYIFITGKAV